MSSSTRRRGPRPEGSDTRADLVDAARAEFSEKGYAAATVRSIAARAGVDPAMINHHFGGKSALFAEVISVNVDPARQVRMALAGPREQLGERVARHFLTMWDDPVFRDPLLALIRSAMTEPDRARLLREYLESSIVPAVARQARGPNPGRQAVLAMTHLVGVVMGRHVVGLGQLQDSSIDSLVADLGPVIQRYLDGEYR